jgi:hypothetical protein
MSRYSQFRFSPLHHEHGFCSSHFCFLARQLLHAWQGQTRRKAASRQHTCWARTDLRCCGPDIGMPLLPWYPMGAPYGLCGAYCGT